MKNIYNCLLLGIALTLACLIPTQAQSSPDAASAHEAKAKAQAAAGINNAVEKDPRVQANGKAWRLDKAVITDATLPRVLLVGDSILNGYMNGVIKSLKGRANVDAWVNPYCQSERFNGLLAEVLANGPYDVVHINLGLHGWQPGRIPPGQFEPLTKAFIEVIRQKCPKAKIIWASSTPVTLKDKPDQLNPEINGIILEHNRMAAKVMAEMNVPVDDLYGLTVSHLDLKANDFHWKPAGMKMQGEAVAKAIVTALTEKH